MHALVLCDGSHGTRLVQRTIAGTDAALSQSDFSTCSESSVTVR